MTSVVISQPMLFPWVGLFEQIRLADFFVFYDDVQFSKGSFTNRVQLKNMDGHSWMTIPIVNLHLGDKILDLNVNNSKDWRKQHREQLANLYSKAPYVGDVLAIVDKVYEEQTHSISKLACASIKAICEYYDLYSNKNYYLSSEMNISGKSSERVLKIVQYFSGDIYVTGHGARKYLDHTLFERNKVRVEYLDYQMKKYPQLYGEFTPFVSILDLIANCGKSGKSIIDSKTIYWKEFIGE